MQTPRLNFTWALIACAALMESTYLLMHVARSSGEQVMLMLVSYAVAGMAFGWLLWLLRSTREFPPGAILVVVGAALIFRVTLWPLPSASSQDSNRYLWEGLVTQAGFDPYLFAPNAEELRHLAADHSELNSRIAYPEIAAVYPPTTQFLFWCNATIFGSTLVGWKALLLIFDVLFATGVWLVLRQRRLSPVHLASVLWCPVLVLETYEAGHTDIIGVALVVWGVVAVMRGWTVLAAVSLGLAFNVKYLWPVLVGALLLVKTAGWRRRALLVGGGAVVAAIMWLPFRAGFTSAWDTMVMFAGRWEFNSVIILALRQLPGPSWLPTAVTAALVATLAVCLGRRRDCDVWADTWLIAGTALLMSPVAFPWYFIWIVAGLAIRPPAWLIWWVLVVGCLHWADYCLETTGQWNRMAWPSALITLVAGVLLVGDWWRRFHPDRATVGSDST